MRWRSREELFPKGQKLIEVKVTKAVLFLTERELMNALPKDVLEFAMQRGKAILRRRKMQSRLKLAGRHG